MLDRNKKMSECTEEEKDEGAYLWLRENYQWERKGLHEVCEKAFRHIDRLLGAKAPVEPTL